MKTLNKWSWIFLISAVIAALIDISTDADAQLDALVLFILSSIYYVGAVVIEELKE